MQRKHLKAMDFHPPWVINIQVWMESNYSTFAKSKTLREIQGEEVPTKAISPPPPDQTGQTGVQTGCKTTICVLLSPGSSFPLCHFQLCPRPSLLIGEVCQAIPPEGLLDTLEDFGTNLDWSTSFTSTSFSNTLTKQRRKNAQIVQKH